MERGAPDKTLWTRPDRLRHRIRAGATELGQSSQTDRGRFEAAHPAERREARFSGSGRSGRFPRFLHQTRLHTDRLRRVPGARAARALVGGNVCGSANPLNESPARRWRLPGRVPARKLLCGNVQVDAPRVDIDLDLISVLHQRQGATDKALWRHVQDAGAVARAAHAGIGYAQHVAHAGLEQLLRYWQLAPFRHAWPALWAAVLEHQHMIRADIEVVAIDLPRHVIVIVECDRFAAMAQQALVRGRRLHDAAARGEIAGEHGGSAFGVKRIAQRMDDVRQVYSAAGNAFAERAAANRDA